MMDDREVVLDDDASNDDNIEDDEEESPWFSVGMTCEEKKATKRSWKLSLIVKLAGRGIEYQFMLQRI